MSRARVTRRLTALTAATALLSAAGLATGLTVGVANAATATAVSPNAVSNAAAAVTTLKITGTGFNPQGAGQSVVLHPTIAGDEATDIKATVVGESSSSTLLTVTAPLTLAAPVPYDVVVTTSFPQPGTATCSSCLLVTNPGRPTVTGVAANGGGGYVTIAGTNFAKGAKVAFLKPDLTVDTDLTFTAGYTDNSGSQPVHVNGIVSPTRIDGQTAHGMSASGRHLLRVTNLDGQVTNQSVDFWQPQLTTTAPSSLGQGAKNIPVTVSGAGIRTGSSVTFSRYSSTNPVTMQSTSIADITVGTSTVSAGNDSITVPVSVSNAGGAQARSVSVTGPDGGFDNKPSLSVTAAPAPAGSPNSFLASPLSVTSFGQGAKDVAATIDGDSFAPNVVFTAGPGVTFVTTAVNPAGTLANVKVTIANDAPVGDVTTLTATNPTDHGTSDYVGDGSATMIPFTINEGPVVTSISPAGLAPGTSKSITLTGTGFNTASSGVAITSSGGLSFTNVVVGSATSMTATATLAGGSAAGPRDVRVVNLNDQGSFTCLACMGSDGLSLSPFAGANTNNDLDVTFTANSGSSLVGATAAALHKTGGASNQPDLVGATTGTAGKYKFNLTNAAPGKYDGVVTVGSSTVSCTGCFTITGTPFTLAPAPGTITPASGGQGAVDFPITLHGGNFVRGEKISIAGTTVSDTTYVNATTLTATISIPAALATGARDVVVTAADGSNPVTVTGAYTIVSGPTISAPTSSAPTKVGQGASGFNVPITGTGFAASVVTISGADVTATTTTSSATNLVARVTAGATAALGARDLKVTNTTNGGSATAVAALLITAKPVVTLVSPAKLAKGATSSFTISGQGFQSNSVASIANVAFSGTPVVSSDGSTITVNGTVSSSAPGGARNVNVDNVDGGHGVCTGCFTVDAPKSAPAFTLGTNTIAAGQRTKVLITGVAGDVVRVAVKGAASTAYTVIAQVTVNSLGQSSVIISPSTNSSYIVSSSTGTSAARALIVKAVQSLVVQRSGHTGIFTGHIAPSVVGRTVFVYFYKTGQHVALGCSTKTTAGGQFKCQRTFTPGTYYTFAQTGADKYNAAGRSSLHSNAF